MEANLMRTLKRIHVFLIKEDTKRQNVWLAWLAIWIGKSGTAAFSQDLNFQSHKKRMLKGSNLKSSQTHQRIRPITRQYRRY